MPLYVALSRNLLTIHNWARLKPNVSTSRIFGLQVSCNRRDYHLCWDCIFGTGQCILADSRNNLHTIHHALQSILEGWSNPRGDVRVKLPDNRLTKLTKSAMEEHHDMTLKNQLSGLKEF